MTVMYDKNLPNTEAVIGKKLHVLSILILGIAVSLGGCGTWATRTGESVNEAINRQDRQQQAKHEKQYFEDQKGSDTQNVPDAQTDASEAQAEQ